MRQQENKPFMVGFDIAKMAGLTESDSRIALSTYVYVPTDAFRNELLNSINRHCIS